MSGGRATAGGEHWLITGASGFLGRHLLQAIVSAGGSPTVIALIRDPEAWRGMEWTDGLTRAQTLTGSVTEPAAWTGEARLEGLTGIFHLAGVVRHSLRDRDLVWRTNVEGTLNLVGLAAAHRCRMVLVSSSGTVACFRQPGQSADEEAPYCEDTVNRWPYYRSKIAAEQRARRLAGELSADLVIVRPPVLLGPGDHRMRSTGYVARFLSGGIPFLIRGGMHFADVRDVAQAIVRVMLLPRARPVYHLPGTVCSIEEFYARVARLAGRRPPRLVLPAGPARFLARVTERLGLTVLPEPALVEMASHYWAMHSKYSADELEYRSRPGDETLADTIAWVREHR